MQGAGNSAFFVASKMSNLVVEKEVNMNLEKLKISIKGLQKERAGKPSLKHAYLLHCLMMR
ncbi:hypothetical protein JCM19236_6577 [Vibrio sp. JCM 19236]|nr:hypothetical protein JCM19236_6577 [Vibrio sp. JCM 19236]